MSEPTPSTEAPRRMSLAERYAALPREFKVYTGACLAFLVVAGAFAVWRLSSAEPGLSQAPAAAVVSPISSMSAGESQPPFEYTDEEISAEVENQQALGDAASKRGDSMVGDPMVRNPYADRFEIEDGSSRIRPQQQDPMSRAQTLEQQRMAQLQAQERMRQEQARQQAIEQAHQQEVSRKATVMAGLASAHGTPALGQVVYAVPKGDFVPIDDKKPAASGAPQFGQGGPAPSASTPALDQLIAGGAGGSSADGSKPAPIQPGDIVFAELQTDINSDEPGPVLAKVVTGPLTGAKVLGTYNRGKEAVVIEFNTLAYDRFSTKITSVALDMETYRTFVATDVDKHTLSRWGGLVLAGMGDGVMNAFERNQQQTPASALVNGPDGQVVQTIQDDDFTDRDILISAFGGIGRALIEIARANFNRSPTVYVAQGTLLGVLFVEEVDADFIPDLQAYAEGGLRNVP